MTQYEKGFEDCKKQVKAAMVAAVENAILMEREACARLCESEGQRIDASWESCATAIRARWQK
tara:strand:+ start:668 stop:856 length:189 start_codon:yes stop_codon:yes gene_type:complete